MTSSIVAFDQPVDDLLSKLFDDELDKGELSYLADQLRCNSQVRQLYHDHIALHTILRWMDGGAEQAGPTNSLSLQYPAASVQGSPLSSSVLAPPSHPTPAFLSTSLHGTLGWFSSGWPVAYLVATVIFGIGLVIGSVVHVSQPEQVANQSVALPSPLSPLPSVVGRITGMVDCRWEKKGLGIRDWGLEISDLGFGISANPQSLVSLGDQFALRSGLLEITYDTGAKVILQGPVTYEVESKDGGFLSLGKLTARLEKTGEGGRRKAEEAGIPKSPFPLPPSSFVVRTPTATVTDLGTEFGVEVSKAGVTDTHVFVGKGEIGEARPSSQRFESHSVGRSNGAAGRTSSRGSPRRLR